MNNLYEDMIFKKKQLEIFGIFISLLQDQHKLAKSIIKNLEGKEIDYSSANYFLIDLIEKSDNKSWFLDKINQKLETYKQSKEPFLDDITKESLEDYKSFLMEE